VSWDYGRLVAEVYELDKPVGSTFAGLEFMRLERRERGIHVV
jgi:hypothetical protein